MAINRTKAARWWSLGLIIVVAAIILTGESIAVAKSRLYADGIAAEAAGNWPRALTQFHALINLEPDYADARHRLDRAVQEMIRIVPVNSKDIAAEIDLLRWLATSQDGATLASVMDRSVISIPAGEFWMGSVDGRSDERPQRSVYLDAFAIDRYEVTNVQYQRFLRVTKHPAPP